MCSKDQYFSGTGVIPLKYGVNAQFIRDRVLIQARRSKRQMTQSSTQIQNKIRSALLQNELHDGAACWIYRVY